jgi:hypothetical protein
MLSHQDGHNSAVALLLKAALIQVIDYRLLGASGLKHALIEEIYIGLMYDDITCIFRDETT